MRLFICSVILSLTADVVAIEVAIKPIDLKVKASVYDDTEPDSKKLIPIPKGKSAWAFSFGELKSFKELREKIGEQHFNLLMKKQKFALPKSEFDGYRGKDRLALHYYVRPAAKEGIQLLFIVSMGEYQPARYIAHLEGIWEISGAGF